MNWVVEEPTRNAGLPPEVERDSWPYGEVVPKPPNPLLASMTNRGDDVPFDPMTKIGLFDEVVEVAEASIERKPIGEVEPKPKLPDVSNLPRSSPLVANPRRFVPGLNMPVDELVEKVYVGAAAVPLGVSTNVPAVIEPDDWIVLVARRLASFRLL